MNHHHQTSIIILITSATDEVSPELQQRRLNKHEHKSKPNAPIVRAASLSRSIQKNRTTTAKVGM